MSIKLKRIECAPIGENTYVIKDENSGLCAVIDPGCFNKAIEDFIGEEKNLAYIILTHAHWDHIASLNEYKDKYPASKLVVNFDEHEMITDSSINGTAQYAGMEVALEADIYVVDGEELKLGDTNLKFITTPGHTKGGMCILADGNLFSGDTLFMRSVGRTDLYGGNWGQLKDSIQNKLFSLDGSTIVYPGHGPSTTIESEKRENPFV